MSGVRAGMGERPRRIRPLGLLTAALCAATALAASTLVLAEDDAGIRAFHRDEAARSAGRPATSAAFAPSPFRFARPPLATRAEFRLGQPVRPTLRLATPRNQESIAWSGGAGRTICVRLCDGFHAPLGHARSRADFSAQEALCEAQNPGVPVKLFRLSAGAISVDRAVAGDGTSYTALPNAYAYEKKADPICRPAIVTAGERHISLLRDITLRPGDSIVLDGKVETFTGSSAFPYEAGDFADFRQAAKLGSTTRRMIDETVGITQAETRQKLLRQSLQVREAPRELADIAELRGTLGADTPLSATLRETILR
ncbi:DUF2865 domain-containing protein [Bosea sp. WAO]|uniref:DUF2865 domain-containing protein n=1 Tax=Bosea sp. WAO TaxID=406341 RepID=UPI000AF874F0